MTNTAQPTHDDSFLDLTGVIGDPVLDRELRLACVRVAFEHANGLTAPERLWIARRITRFVICGDTPDLRRRAPAAGAIDA